MPEELSEGIDPTIGVLFPEETGVLILGVLLLDEPFQSQLAVPEFEMVP